MEKKPFLRLSVHQLVDFLLRKGDIDDRIYNQETMNEGSRIHANYQKIQDGDYISEYSLGETFARENGTIELSGRADGIIIGGEYPIIDEIKSTVSSIEEFYQTQKAWHYGQAECYALMYARQKNIDKIAIKLTYISQKDGSKMERQTLYSLPELEEKVYGYMDEYLSIYQKQFAHLSLRDYSASKLKFPFPKFRSGQRDLSKYCYSIANKGGIFFAEAPTGIGKTMSTLFPAAKSFANGKLDRIFYLTAKTTGKKTAKEALNRLHLSGLVSRESILLGKDKICFNKGASCNPDSCPYAKDYYGKIKHIILEALEDYHSFDETYVIELAKKYAVCPFELSLDLSLWSDVIVGDYNYFFDPFVYLDRFFGPEADPSKSVLLIDEAHNLLSRARDMYSAKISLSNLNKAKKSLKGKKERSLLNVISKIKKAMEELEENLEDSSLFILNEPPKSISKAIESLKRAKKKRDEENNKKLSSEFDDFYLECHRYQKLLEEYFGSNCIIFLQLEKGDLTLSLSCLDPSSYLKDSLSKVKGSIFFSATFSPILYYQNALLGREDYPYLLLSSPFPKENFKLLLAPKISTRYKDREKTFEEVASYLKAFVSKKVGNYFFYFPSYEYLNKIESFLNIEDANCFRQSKDMNEEERENFLLNFPNDPKSTNIGFLILGGAFSEGIDMIEDRLIGVALVGIGLPMVSKENDLLKDYFENKLGEGKGFDYAYKNPGMNKVMQAVGRLIRSETDRGMALLIDDRYMKEEYRTLFSRIWEDYEVCLSPEEVGEEASKFFEQDKK